MIHMIISEHGTNTTTASSRYRLYMYHTWVNIVHDNPSIYGFALSSGT